MHKTLFTIDLKSGTLFVTPYRLLDVAMWFLAGREIVDIITNWLCY